MGLNRECPECRSTNIWVADGPYYDGPDDCWRDMHCMDCGAYWKETYGMNLKTIEKVTENGTE